MWAMEIRNRVETIAEPREAKLAGEENPCRIVRAEVLFGGSHGLDILFHGQRYQLRVTRSGKLILTK